MFACLCDDSCYVKFQIVFDDGMRCAPDHQKINNNKFFETNKEINSIIIVYCSIIDWLTSNSSFLDQFLIEINSIELRHAYSLEIKRFQNDRFSFGFIHKTTLTPWFPGNKRKTQIALGGLRK